MKYKYIGDGAGIPGLPHEITDEEAERDGLTEMLAEAIRNGKYEEVKSGAPAPKQSKKKNEVNDG